MPQSDTETTGYPKSRWWTSREVAIWLSALILTIILGIMFVTKVVGTWVVLIQGGLAMGVGLMRYRSEAAQEKRNAAARDE
jgi:hypothetical protein